MGFLRENKLSLILSGLCCALALLFVWHDNWVFYTIPIALIAIYAAIFETRKTFLALFLLTPLSVNLEEFVPGIGLFVPTEPLLAGLMLLALALQLKKPFIPAFIWRSPLTWLVILYLIWIFICSITSAQPVVSIKYLLAKLWFVVPIFAFGSQLFQRRNNIRIALWLLSIGMVIAMLYTLVMHASYQFGEQEGHWVMSPLFKDHTIYGALVAFILPILVGIYFSKKHSPLIQAVLIGFIGVNLIALYFSYTRAAWLSIVVALGVWLIIRLRIKFSVLAISSVSLLVIVFFSWTSIQHVLEKNKSEHTTEDFGKRLESVSNVTTDASNLERLNRWSCAIDMFQERPVFGFGPGTYAFEYARFQRPENLTIISTNFGDLGNAHSEYLGPLAETGIVGLLCVLALVAYMFYLGITLYLKIDAADHEMKVLVLAMVLALVTYFFHGILNNYWDTDKAAVPIWSFCVIFVVVNHQMTKGLAAKKS